MKQLPREYSGPRHIVTVGRRVDGREECEEQPGEPPPNHEPARDENVLRIYIVYAAETTREIREPNLENGKADWMKTALLKRLKRLEEVRVVETQASFELQMGYLIRLRQEYTGERHVVTVGRDGNGIYRWEERHGAPPANEDGPTSIIRLFLVRAKDGRPDYFSGADRRSHVVLLAFFPSYNALDLWVDQWRNTQIERTVVSTLVSDSLMDSCMRWRSFVRGRRMHTHESC